MHRFSALVAVIAIVPMALPVIASPLDLTWKDLAPVSAEIANPFEALSSEQMDTLRTIHRLESGVQQQGESETPKRAQELRAALAAQGLDADALFASRLEIIKARRTAAAAVNDKVLDRDVRLPGYILPLKLEDRRTTEFLLVPTVGACIHTPPPPANQMVHVFYPRGIEVDGLYDPVWVKGNLRSQTTKQGVRYVDGSADIEVSYSMQAEDVAPYLIETE